MRKFFVLSFFIIVFGTHIFAQSFLGKQHSLQLSEEDMMDLSGGQEDLDKQASFFFKLDYNDVLKKAKAMDLNPETDEGTIFIDGKLFRMDMASMGQKMTFILNLETREIYSIMHDQKQYFAMNLDEMKAMQAKIKKDMEGMMENLPPEAKAMMEKMSGQKKSAPPIVTATGKSKTINGFSAKEYLVTKENSREQLWITTEYSDLRDAFFEIATAMPEAEEDSKMIWDQIKDGWPVSTSEIVGQHDYMEASFSIHEVYSLKKATHKAGTFDPPAGYTKKTMEDMMGGMQDYEE